MRGEIEAVSYEGCIPMSPLRLLIEKEALTEIAALK